DGGQRSSPSHGTTVASTSPGGNQPVARDHDESGAVKAALAYAAASQDWLYLTDDEVVEAVRAVATPASADRLSHEVLDQVRTARGSLVESSGRVWWIVRPLAWRVDDYATETASVSVWTVSVLSAIGVAVPQTEWATTTLDLEWTAGGWRVAAAHDSRGP